MDLIRAILLYAEEHEGNETLVIASKKLPEIFHEFTIPVWSRHCNLIVERGLAKGVVHSNGLFQVSCITWEGYDFLDNSRSPEVWNAAKKAAGHLSFEVFKSALTHLAINHGLGLLKSGYAAAVDLAIGVGS